MTSVIETLPKYPKHVTIIVTLFKRAPGDELDQVDKGEARPKDDEGEVEEGDEEGDEEEEEEEGDDCDDGGHIEPSSC